MDDPFAQDAAIKAESDAIFGSENTGINFDAYEDIPVETSGHDCPPHVDKFEELDLGEALLSNIRRCKYTKPTPVQRYAIPIGLAGRDMMACAQTGSGKTAAFCFPMIAGLLKAGYQPTGRNRKAYPAALVLAPTRELTIQIFEEARKFSYQTGLRPVVAYGGAPVTGQVRQQQSAWIARCSWQSGVPLNVLPMVSFDVWDGADVQGVLSAEVWWTSLSNGDKRYCQTNSFQQ
jgi:ATP-dependent RNA helicase DDX3X